MLDKDLRGIGTTAKLAGQARATASGRWWPYGRWVLGIATTALAAVVGLTDFLGNARSRAINHAWHHLFGNVTAVVLSIASFWLRMSHGAGPAILPWGLVLFL